MTNHRKARDIPTSPTVAAEGSVLEAIDGSVQCESCRRRPAIGTLTYGKSGWTSSDPTADPEDVFQVCAWCVPVEAADQFVVLPTAFDQGLQQLLNLAERSPIHRQQPVDHQVTISLEKPGENR